MRCKLRKLTLTGLLFLPPHFMTPSAALSQTNPDVCQSVRQDDAASLVTLNQATVRTSADGENRCSFQVEGSFGTVGRLDLKVKQFTSHAEAVAYMKNELPFYFDKKPSLVKTDDAGDHVDTLLSRPDSSESEAVHGNVMAEVEINQQEPAARAHPSYEYRLERLALQAAGATILPTAGLPPDPVLPQRQQAAATKDSSTGIPGWFMGGAFGISALALLGPAIAIFVLYRVLLVPRLRRGRLIKTGIDGSAYIESVSDTGVTINGSPQVKYDCLITPANGSPAYKSSTRAVTSRLVSSASLVGTTRPVKIDPTNSSVFIFR